MRYWLVNPLGLSVGYMTIDDIGLIAVRGDVVMGVELSREEYEEYVEMLERVNRVEVCLTLLLFFHFHFS